MKKVAQINTVCNESTGRIMREIQIQARQEGYETISLVGRRKIYKDLKCIKFGNGLSFWLHVIINTLFDKQGYGSYLSTKKLVRILREEKPDIIHLHNLHGYYLHIPTLIKYLNDEFDGSIFWTFHDCWPFTGHCPHFTMMGCDKWKTGCNNCPNKKEYPISWFLDSSKSNYKEKKAWFTDLKKLTIIVPSYWMKENVKSSFMKVYPIQVVFNGIDLDIFRRVEAGDIRNRFNIPYNKKILLGVASVWSKGKGLEDFWGISSVISQEYVIVLVGLNYKQGKKLPGNIIGITHIESREELARLYSAAHIFINPSLEESFSLVTIEAIACGTPVISLDTSAVKELVMDKTGIVLHEHSPNDYLKAIKDIELLELDRNEISKCAMNYSSEAAGKKIVNMYNKLS